MEYYDLGTLFATEYDGVATWVTRRFGEWYLGGVLGEAFSDAVIQNVNRLYEGLYQDWTV